ncbi:MAG: betaine--homocysteine S-methyltransferase [Geminicoccaceae bacterium]|nr:betaine--homocysteine S-methyltransferase [Geminicoccaceae bacterium]
MNVLEETIAARGVLLADGGMGTALFRRGLETGDGPELWNIDHPERVADVHREFIEAGCDIVLTNSFGGNRHRLELHAAQHRVAELNGAAARIARHAADDAGRDVLVAGSMGPTGEILAPVGALDPAEAEAAFAEQAAALEAGAVDLLWIETLSSMEELVAALRGAATTGLPVVATLSFDTNGRTMMGVSPKDALVAIRPEPYRPAAFGANCGVGPAQLLGALLELRAAAGPGDRLVAKGNCGIPEYRDGQIHYSGTPSIMADYARLARDAGAAVIGGCCGTTGVHLQAMREVLDREPAGPLPDATTIERLLGPLAAPPAPSRQTPREGRRRRRG